MQFEPSKFQYGWLDPQSRTTTTTRMCFANMWRFGESECPRAKANVLSYEGQA